MDYQLLTFLILGILTISIVSLVVYVIVVLKEARQTIRKANNFLDNSESISAFFSNPLEGVSTVISTVVKTIKEIRKEL